MTVLDKFRGGRELVRGRELVHHQYSMCIKYMLFYTTFIIKEDF